MKAMKRIHVALALAFVVCAGVLLFADRNPANQIVEAAPRTSRPDATRAAGSGAAAGVSIAALRARADLFGSDHGEHHDLFGSQSWAPPLPSLAPAHAEVPPLPPLPPSSAAPGLPFTYLGKKAADGRWEVYLASGDETVIVSEQTVIGATYRVDAIKPPTMTLVYLPLKLVQTLDIGSAD
ncbi:hypothetical protein PQR36_35325 [Paraburkholderia nemoris]|uniref:hypothetical protein n=1 Tax=Paraburkholderia nemoris TaxID=2793076 RepID=UPI0038BB4393